MKMKMVKAVMAVVLMSPLASSADEGPLPTTQRARSAIPQAPYVSDAPYSQRPSPPADAPAGTPTSTPAQPGNNASNNRPSDLVKVPVSGSPAEPGDLRELIGVNPAGLRRIEMPRLPTMSVRGFIKPSDQEPIALLEITELSRTFLVQTGTEIPVMVTGRVTPIGQAELTGLGKTPAAPPVAAGSTEQSQIILKVKKVTTEGVIVETGVLAQTIVIR